MLVAITMTVIGFGTELRAGQFLDANGHLKRTIQENGKNGYMILDEHGYAQSYIQENGNDGYMILDSEGFAQGYYQED